LTLDTAAAQPRHFIKTLCLCVINVGEFVCLYVHFCLMLRKKMKGLAIAKPKKKRPVVVEKVLAPRNARKEKEIIVAEEPAPQESSSSHPGLLSSILGVGGSLLGNLIAPGVGGKIGGSLGSAAGSLIGHITGMGAYHVERNSLIPGAWEGPLPTFGGDGSTILRKRECLGDIIGSTAFNITAYPINPGLFGTFPFLSGVAAQYDQYEMLGCVFEFVSTSGDALTSTNTAMGTVVLATNYDVLDAPFSNKIQMESYEFASSAKPGVNQIHPVECSPAQNLFKNLTVRSAGVPAGGDQHFYDLGIFYIATVGMQAAATIGELWVEYHVKLLKPKLATPLNAGLVGAHLIEAAPGTASAANILGTGIAYNGITYYGAPYQWTNLYSGVQLNGSTTTNTFLLPFIGTFMIQVYVAGSVAAAPSMSFGSNIINTGSATPPRYHFKDGASSFISGFTAAGQGFEVLTVDVLASGTGSANLVTLSGCTSMSSGTCDVFITPFPGPPV